jgi:hypothetical protein
LRVLLFRSTEQEIPGAVPLAAGSGLALLPLTGELGDDERVAGFYDLTTGIAERARELSRRGTVAYLHSEFFGGGGFHAAIAWRDGEVAWGPRFTANMPGEGDRHYVVVEHRDDMAANVLLRWLGVRRGNAIDEYAAAGLNRHRHSEQWAERE